MDKHSFGGSVQCAMCGKRVTVVFAPNWEAATHGLGICEDCFPKPIEPSAPNILPVEEIAPNQAVEAAPDVRD